MMTVKKGQMKTMHNPNVLIVEEGDKKKSSERNDERNITDGDKTLESFLTLLQNETAMTRKRKNYFLRRISPFLLLAAFLIIFFPLMFITNTGKIESTWLKAILFPFILINILFADFTIWNYFEGKKRLLIWVIELSLSVLILYLLL